MPRGACAEPASDERERAPRRFDYVIVGAGSAGCVAGQPADRGRQARACCCWNSAARTARSIIQMPAALSIPMNMKTYNWGYESEPEPHLNGRRTALPARQGARRLVLDQRPRLRARQPARFRPLGGGGRARLGLSPTCCPISAAPRRSRGGADAYRGGDGPLVDDAAARKRNPLYDAFIEAGRQAGYPVSADLNGEQQEGFGALRHDGEGRRALVRRQRLSASGDEAPEPDASSPTRWRPGSPFEGRRAVGVRYERGGRDAVARARREVILCGGRDQLAAAAEALRRRPGGGAAARSASPSSPTCRASARTCRTISNFISRSPRSSRSRSTARPGSWRAAWSACNGCCAARASARPIISRPAASSARAPASAIPTSSIISCRWR